MNKTNRDHNGAGGSSFFLSALALILITLKLTGVIAWSWWWVTAPLWGPFGLILAFLAVLGMAWCLFAIYEHITKKSLANVQKDQASQNSMQGFDDETLH